METKPLHPVPEHLDALRRWLVVVAGMVFFMVVLGGVTRLTESGLSMVDWHPVTGWLPPLSDEAWLAEFEKYKTSPEYTQKNSWMTVEDFKGIFWLEYLHRLMGRLIGLAFAVPFFFFLFRGWIPGRLKPAFWGLLVLGGLQGVMGWYMVQSGLVDRPAVSQYRLASHLGLAFVIYGALLWMILRLKEPRAGPINPYAAGLVLLIFAQIISGAFVAGLDAGYIYNTWPLIDGAFIPGDIYAPEGFWVTGFEDNRAAQFNHRMLAYIVTLAVAVFFWRYRKDGPYAHALMGMTAVQVLLGIVTLIMVVPVWMGAIHQAGALVLYSIALWTAYRLRA
ncbi:MAG: COX15/CtaA family protein [Alphaproteobacteria bacterium]|nr:COX15/CtaA family protein [Alphaproteobacteria bacterium]